jgi:hypothetical protein
MYGLSRKHVFLSDKDKGCLFPGGDFIGSKPKLGAIDSDKQMFPFTEENWQYSQMHTIDLVEGLQSWIAPRPAAVAPAPYWRRKEPAPANDGNDDSSTFSAGMRHVLNCAVSRN